jgi:ribose 5-phosphate isomerase A
VTQDELKRQAAARAVELIRPGMKLGLGSGSTARLVIEALAERRRRGELADIVGVPTSTESRDLASLLQIPLGTLDDEPRLDITIDGADEVDPSLGLIKGLGGALLWEKIVASATTRFVVVVDESKLVDRLGTRSPLPVEVVPFGWRTQLDRVRSLGAEPTLRLNEAGDPFVTDGNHYILDCAVDGGIEDPARVEAALQATPGVVETGLFLGMAETVVVAGDEGTRLLRRGDGGDQP